MREASRDYTPPDDACTSFRALYSALVAFEKDLHQHIHLENNVLFPRAIEMENVQTKR
jgi:regulator of cell morphogenesis and NO signaling